MKANKDREVKKLGIILTFNNSDYFEDDRKYHEI